MYITEIWIFLANHLLLQLHRIQNVFITCANAIHFNSYFILDVFQKFFYENSDRLLLHQQFCKSIKVFKYRLRLNLVAFQMYKIFPNMQPLTHQMYVNNNCTTIFITINCNNNKNVINNSRCNNKLVFTQTWYVFLYVLSSHNT